MPNNKELKQIAKYIYECGILNKTPRSGLWFLGTGKQSVAEHVLRTTLIGLALSHLVPKANKYKIIMMCLTHDLGEGRTSDLNYVHQKYGSTAEMRALKDIADSIPFGKEVANLFNEFEDRKTLEAKLTRDADQLEWIATLRDEQTKGNVKALSWAKLAYKRLKTPVGKKIAKMLFATHPDDWWYRKDDKWFVHRRGGGRK